MSVEDTMLQGQMALPKSTQGIFDLPCGLLLSDGALATEVEVREITGVEEDLLASRAVPAAKKIDSLLTNCVKRLGPYSDKMTLGKAMLDLTIGDRTFLVMAIRRVTLGDEFSFDAKCPECSKKGNYTVLLSDLEVKKMPDPTQRVHETKLPSGKIVKWHVMNGRDEQALSKVKDAPNDLMTLALMVRVDELEGQKVNVDVLKALGLRDRNFLRAAFEDVEGGLDTEVDIGCTYCSHEFKTDVDVSQSGFFFPSPTRKS